MSREMEDNDTSQRNETSSYCSYSSSLGEGDLFYLVIIGGAIFIILAFLRKRKRLLTGRFDRPGVPESVDFLSNRHRWPVVLTFCASAFAILTLATVDIDETVVMKTALVYAPLIMCAGSDEPLFTPLIGCLYGYGVLGWYLYSAVLCWQSSEGALTGSYLTATLFKAEGTCFLLMYRSTSTSILK